ncbi:hypothetical protein DYB30_013981, partial [Aphanomyces astaci]
TTGKKHPLILVLKTTASKIKAAVEENLSQRHGFGKQDRFKCHIYGNPMA